MNFLQMFFESVAHLKVMLRRVMLTRLPKRFLGGVGVSNGILILSLLSGSVHADEMLKLTEGEVEALQLKPETIEMLKTLLRMELQNRTDAHYISKTQKDETNAEVDLIVTRLEAKYLLQLQLRHDSRILRSRNSTLKSFDEMDIAIKRLLTALIEDSSVKETAERGLAFGAEQSTPNRVKSISGFELSMGGMIPFSEALNTHRPMYSFGFGYLWELNPAILEIRTDFMGGFGYNRSFGWTGTLGGHYILASYRHVAAFAGAEVGFGFLRATSHKDGYYSDYGRHQSGFVFAGDIGLLLFRESDVNFDIRYRTLVLADTINGQVPVVGGLMLGIRF